MFSNKLVFQHVSSMFFLITVILHSSCTYIFPVLVVTINVRLTEALDVLRRTTNILTAHTGHGFVQSRWSRFEHQQYEHWQTLAKEETRQTSETKRKSLKVYAFQMK